VAVPSAPLDGVNRSGYPLQIALAHEVESRTKAHGWRVLYREHSWRNRTDQGFIDLVLEHEVMQVVLVVECKRVKDGDWVFLPDNGNADIRRYARGYYVGRSSPSLPPGTGWADRPADPKSPQAAFCVMPKDARDPTVDALAAELVSATEALADEEVEAYLTRRGGAFRRIYYPAVVTTARLWVCSFAPSDIALDSGTLPPASLREEFSVVRYTKQLSTQRAGIPSGIRYGTEAAALASAKARTAFVIVADHLDSFLCDFTVDDRSKY
jgi:hypothetical protein